MVTLYEDVGTFMTTSRRMTEHYANGVFAANIPRLRISRLKTFFNTYIYILYCV